MDPNTALLIANGLLILVTASLVIVTWRYTTYTKKMADTMYKDHLLKLKPSLKITKGDIKGYPQKFERDLILTNDGSNNVYIKNVVSRLTRTTAKIPEGVILHDAKTITLKPGEKKSYLITIDIAGELPILDFYNQRNFYIFFNYEWSGPDQNFKHKKIDLIS